MEKTWKFACLCLVVSVFKLCNGFPIHFERTIADPQIQLLSGVLAVVVTICTLLLIAGCLCCQRGSGFKEFRDSPVVISTVGSAETGLVNPTADGAFTIFAPLSRQTLSGSRERCRTDEDYIYGDINVTSWFNEGERDFPRGKLKYIRELGKGWFGRVVEGTAQDVEGENTWTPVVVRILDSTAATKERVFFLHEAEIYRCGDHTNILKLYGRCLDLVPFLLLQEFCPQGDLKSYLLSNRPSAENLLASEYPLIWCCQITSAVKFLHEKGLAHSDLACRNCQLAANLTLKLGDYGLAASRYPEDYYEGAISVRWCAPESIRHTSTTIRSEQVTREANVWSLAVCFWEICECGERPYAHLNDDEVVERVLGRGCDRLSRPSKGVLYADYIYRLMQSCWLTPESRPTATQIYLTLTDLLQVFTVCKAEYEAGSLADSQESRESFDARWNSLKPNALKSSDGAAETSDQAGSKPTSPSLNNLIGSLEDMNGSRNSDEYNAHSVLLPNPSNQKFEFKLGPQSKDPLETDSLNDSMIFTMRRSSSSETEEENWKRKIERGAYTEKVRQKSRSVTDLMVLTHIDYSESESETPQPSLDHRVNYKNVRMAPKLKLESASYVHGSEGNLLSVQDDFQAELRKLQEEHRDSLFFVPDKFSQIAKGEQINNNVEVDETKLLMDSPSERLFKELNSTTELKPANQVYNVFSVTIDNISPVHAVKLNEIINLEEPRESKMFAVPYEVPKLCDIIQNNANVGNLMGDSGTVSPVEVSNAFISNERQYESICREDFASCSTSQYSIDGVLQGEHVTEDDEFRDVNHQDVLPTSRRPDPEGRECKIEKEELESGDEMISPAVLTTRQKSSINELSKDANADLNPEEPNNDESKLLETSHGDCSEEATENQQEVTDVSKVIEGNVSDVDENKCLEMIQNEPETECKEENRSDCDLESSDSLFIAREVCEQFDSFGGNSSADVIVEEISSGVTEDSVDSDCFLEGNGNRSNENCEQLEETILTVSNDSNIDLVFSDVTIIVDKASHSPEKLQNQNDCESVSGEKLEEGHTCDVEILGSESREEILNNTNDISDSLNSTFQKEMPIDKISSEITVPDRLEDNLPEHDSNIAKEKSQEGNTENKGVVLLKEFLDEERKANEFAAVEYRRETNSDSLVQMSKIDVTNERKMDVSVDFGSNQDNEVEALKKFLDEERKANELVVVEKQTKTNSDSVVQMPKKEASCQTRKEEIKTPNKKKLHQVPKLIEMIENDDKLMDYIIANYESELHDDLSYDNSRKTNSPLSSDTVVTKAETSRETFDESERSNSLPVVDFDLSDDQETANPNPLTHFNAFANSRTRQRSLEFTASTPTKKTCSSLGNAEDVESADLKYSLETWDNFLGRAIDSQNRSMGDQTFVFESLEPRSLIYLEDGEARSATTTPPNSDMETSLEGEGDATVVLREGGDYLNGTYGVSEGTLNETYDVEGLNSTFTTDVTDQPAGVPGKWDSSGGWFLHPQSSTSVSGNLTEQKKDNGSYVRFGMDDEILAALRGELLAKLPHAQGTSSDKVKENDDDWDPSEKDEVFLRYNVYNTPLSPIPEESDNEGDENSLCSSPGSPDSTASDDWPEKFLDGAVVATTQDADSQSLRGQGRHRHTPSQDSCCSNDTLFNLEEMTCADQREEEEAKSNEKIAAADTTEERLRTEAINYFKFGTALGAGPDSPITDLESPMEQVQDKTYLMDFLVREREHSEMASVVVTEPQLDLQSDSNSSKSVPMNRNNVAPFPSPDDHPWKQLSASLLSLDRSQKKGLLDLDFKESEDSDSTYVNRNENIEDVRANQGDEIDETYCAIDVSSESINYNYSSCVNEDNVAINVGKVRVDDSRGESEPGCENVSVNEGISDIDLDYENVFVGEEIDDNDPGYEYVRVNDCDDENCPDYENVRVNDCDDENRPDYENVRVNDCHDENRPDYENVRVNDCDDENRPDYENVRVNDCHDENRPQYENVRSNEVLYTNEPNYALPSEEREDEEASLDYVNAKAAASMGEVMGNIYENMENVGDVINEEDYVNITNLENCKMNAEFDNVEKIDMDETCTSEYQMEDDDLVVREAEGEGAEKDDTLFGVLTDIRFSGPGGEPHLMSTSFSESNNDERDWDSGSDTRSSSSGEFIWKEGEHEESLKALQALPQDPLDNEPKEGHQDETSSESSCSDEEGVCPEFIPSAWDKYATPTKSAMRSPEKTLEKEEKKGVWFKKQRYHCVYEYPREPESPVLQSFDLWNNTPPATSYPDWYFDIDSGSDFSEFTSSNFQDGDTLSTDFNAGFNDEFYVTSSATPFDMLAGSTSQFFPGDHWSDASKLTENTTPDSGVEDATPGSLERIDLAGIETSPVALPSLKMLAEAAHAKSKLAEKEGRSGEILGGLRHTRDKLKLDLPTSPNTFSANKTFSLEPIAEPIVLRERPSFTTFGKSRFFVQHVDTPDRGSAGKNVCFEALPYKPPETKAMEERPKKTKGDGEKGEASLLDSADEDSGIESSTLERKSANVTAKLIVDL